ncbi:cupin domain-containing protein [Streptomyces phaeochromogenes]|uniref:hypothetical protein n=1 Tax=Streptomyces phaeochromogenes TaxID=1923 RepID=UPI0036C7F145
MEILKQPPTIKGPADMFAGDVWFDVIHRGEAHWHGAAPDHFMTHLALWENAGPDAGPESTWFEHVADGEYSGPRRSTHR